MDLKIPQQKLKKLQFTTCPYANKLKALLAASSKSSFDISPDLTICSNLRASLNNT
jgi:hypothetical protein